MASIWYWCVSLQVEYFGTLTFTKMQVPYLSFSLYHLIVCHFFQVLLTFWRTFNTFEMKGQSWLFWTDVGLFVYGWRPWTPFRTRYHIFPRVICVATHVTTLLWEFCTVSNELLLLAHYYMDYIMPYYTFSVK